MRINVTPDGRIEFGNLGNELADYMDLPPYAFLRTLPEYIICPPTCQNINLVSGIIVKHLIEWLAMEDLILAFEVKYDTKRFKDMGYNSYEQACEAAAKLNTFTDLLIDKDANVNETIEQFTKNTEE